MATTKKLTTKQQAVLDRLRLGLASGTFKTTPFNTTEWSEDGIEGQFSGTSYYTGENTMVLCNLRDKGFIKAKRIFLNGVVVNLEIIG